MKKMFTVLLLAGILAPSLAPAQLTIENHTISNITETSAVIQVDLSGTDGGDPNVYLYYGRTDGGYTTGNWDEVYSYGTASVGVLDMALTNLVSGYKYYYRAYATEDTNYAWATATSNFLTKVYLPTSTVPIGYMTILVDSNGVIIVPTNVQFPIDSTFSGRMDQAEIDIDANATNIFTVSQRVDVVEGIITNTTNIFALHTNNESPNILHFTQTEKEWATQAIQGVYVVTGETASAETNSGIVKLTVPDPGASAEQWSSYEQTNLIYRVCWTPSNFYQSGWLTPWTNAWGAGWSDAGTVVGFTNEGSPLLYPEGDSTFNFGQYLVNTMLAPSTSSIATVSIATSNDTVLGVEARIDSSCLYDVYASTGYAYFIIGSITSDVRVITNIPYHTSWGTSHIGASNDLWGLSAENFIGETNIDICVYVVSVESNTEFFLDYLSANITYITSGTGRYFTNTFGFTSNGTFIIQDDEVDRYPLVELDTLNGKIETNTSPYQAFSATVDAVDGTATVAFAHGSLVRIYCTNDTTLAFDSTDYPTSGVSRVAVELWADTNSIAFDSTTINTNDFAPTISSNDWTSLFFRRSGTNSWTGRY